MAKHIVKSVIYTEHLGRSVENGADWQDLEGAVEEAIESVMPHARHNVQVVRNVSGAGSGTWYSVDGCDMSGTKEHEALEYAVNSAVERWVRN